MSPESCALLRHGTSDDLSALAPLSGSADRALARLRAHACGEEVLLVAQHGESVVGAVSVRWRGTCDAPHPWLYGLHVRHDLRRNGFGALLTKAAETAASLHGASAVSLDVDHDENKLIAYYERLGYVRIAPHRHHWRSLDVGTGAVTAEGVADTWIMRHTFGGAWPLSVVPAER